MNLGYVKFDRKIKDWGWYTDVNTFKLFFHLIAFANFADGECLGVPIKRGQIARSYSKLSIETGLSEREIRTALKHLEMTGEVTGERHPKFTVFTIKNYTLYQSSDSQTTDERHSNDTRATDERQRDKKNKNNKNNKKENIFSKREYTKEKTPTVEEVRAYCLERKNNVDAEHFVNYYTANGWLVGKNKMKDWKAAVRTWEHNGYDTSRKTICEKAEVSGFDTDEFFNSAVKKAKRKRANDNNVQNTG